MTYFEVLQKLKKKQISPIYLVYGTEAFFIQKLRKQLIKAVITDNEGENLSEYDLEETPIQDIISDVETYPFFGEKKIIIASNPTFLTAKPQKLSFEHHLEVLYSYLEQPVDYSVLLFIAPYEKIDERKKVSKLLKKHGTVALCNPIKEYELTKWIKDIADQFGITIEQDAYEILESVLVANLNLLYNEIEKLTLYVGKGGIVTREIVEALISHTGSSSSLRLVDAVIGRDLHKAISIYKELQKTKENPIALTALLASQFRTILRVKLLKQKGYNQAQLQKEILAHPYVIKMALTREKRFTVQKLENILEKLAIADSMMKQGNMEKELAFELLIYDLVHETIKG